MSKISFLLRNTVASTAVVYVQGSYRIVSQVLCYLRDLQGHLFSWYLMQCCQLLYSRHHPPAMANFLTFYSLARLDNIKLCYL